MNSKYLVFGAVIIAIFAGALMAIQGATTNNVAGGAVPTRWAGASASSDLTEGGNITLMNLSATELTERWAAYYGNVTGTIILGDLGARIYQWSYTIASGGEVCMATDSAQTFAGMSNATPAVVDTAFGLGSTNDNAANTLNISNCTLVLSTGTEQNTTCARHQGNSTFFTAVIVDAGNTTEADFAFCTNISSTGRWFGSSTGVANYELMVPTTPTAGATETYFFYAELG